MIVAVWGNAGSGNSTLAIKLALACTKRHLSTILVDCNYVAPQTKIWFPRTQIKPEQSLATILQNEVEQDNVVGKITMVNEYLGVLGYTKDLSINCIPGRDDTPVALLGVLESVADVVIIDCQSNITQDVLSFVALDLADVRVISMSPDLRGLSWYESNIHMLKDKWDSHGDRVIKTFNKVKINAPFDSIASAIGNIDYYLPYYDEIEEQLYIGTYGESKYKGKSKKYGITMESLAEDVLQNLK